MHESKWFSQLTEDSSDPHTPLFHETVAWLRAHKADLEPPKLELPEPSIAVKILELQREVAIKTPTQLLPVLDTE